MASVLMNKEDLIAEGVVKDIIEGLLSITLVSF